MNNSVFGKTMENFRKRIKCEVVTNEKRRSKLISSLCYEYINIINDEVVVIKSKQIEVELKAYLLWVQCFRFIKSINV